MKGLLTAAGLGLLLGGGAWSVLNLTGQTQPGALAAQTTALRAMPRPAPATTPLPVAISRDAEQVFGKPTPIPTLRLVGIAQTPRRRAALIEIGGAPALWWEVGANRNGLILVEVSPTQATLDSADGPLTVKLGQTLTPTVATPGGGRAVMGGGPDQIPAGFRSPPPPADAPKSKM